MMRDMLATTVTEWHAERIFNALLLDGWHDRNEQFDAEYSWFDGVYDAVLMQGRLDPDGVQLTRLCNLLTELGRMASVRQKSG